MKFIIRPEIFEIFPGIRFVVAAAYGVEQADAAGIMNALNAAWQSAAVESSAYGNPQSHPNIKPWGERMKDAGAPRKKFPCSIEALVRRAGKDGTPVSINPLVDFYNAVSLKHIVPAGAFDIAALENDLELRLSAAGDTFLAMDENEAVDIPPGEVSYADGSTIITRHFVWKQSQHAIIRPETRDVFFVSEILGELPPETAESVRADLAEGLMQYFGAQAQAYILGSQNPCFEAEKI